MRLTRTISIVGVHCAGKVGDVIVGGVFNPPHCKTMYEKLLYFQNEADDIRKFLMNEPRSRPANVHESCSVSLRSSRRRRIAHYGKRRIPAYVRGKHHLYGNGVA
ncbi:uncharacterized protein ACHE_10385A [Aspergillus chevalieri]|uniref:Uncharacterized protein n=1 Tax=Aspergillus chevalieri TaxID=182096 RepID=A0A7R7ZI76_ASPCH|nr:uncharacterized protein ACHE_10385A [Aspergillus chevalieri]BCR82983.1 hypothetical protein ACHE_10385A [Aspergillus chevalieri]